MILVAANIFVYSALLTQHTLKVSVLNVGEENAVLVRSQNGATILIDTGPDANILRALGAVLQPWQRKIDIVLLTNAGRKAAGGLQDVLSRYKVSRQITITKNQRIAVGGAYIDIVISKNATSSVYISNGKTVDRVK